MPEIKVKRRNFIIVVLIVMIILMAISMVRKSSYSHKVRLLKFGKFPIEKLEEMPTDDFAWGYNLPSFILRKMSIAEMLDYDGVEYTYGENSIQIRKDYLNETPYITVNDKLGGTMYDPSIFVYEDEIYIYGYWNDEFRCQRVKKEGDEPYTVLTPHEEIPFSASAQWCYELIPDCYLAVSANGDVSAYQNKEQLGDTISIKGIKGNYAGMLLTDKGELYMPYIVDEKLVCNKVKTLDNATMKEMIALEDSYWYEEHKEYEVCNYLNISYYAFPMFTEGEKRTVLMPNDVETYIEYNNGNRKLSRYDDISWKEVVIK